MSNELEEEDRERLFEAAARIGGVVDDDSIHAWIQVAVDHQSQIWAAMLADQLDHGELEIPKSLQTSLAADLHGLIQLERSLQPISRLSPRQVEVLTTAWRVQQAREQAADEARQFFVDAAAIDRLGYDSTKMVKATLGDGTVVLAYVSPPSERELAAAFPIETKGGGRLARSGDLMALTSDGTVIVYLADDVALMRREALLFIARNMTVNRRHPEMARRHAVLLLTNPRRRGDRALMKRVWGER